MPIAAPALSDQRMLAPTCALYRPAAALSGRSAQEQWRATQVISLLQDAFSAKQAAWDSAYYRLLSEFRELESKLVKLSGLQANWNSYGADGPDAGAINTTRLILRLLLESAMVPRQVAASAEGGVVICFVQGHRYAEIEILNTGELAAVMYERGGEPTLFDLTATPDDILNAISRIREQQDRR